MTQRYRDPMRLVIFADRLWLRTLPGRRRLTCHLFDHQWRADVCDPPACTRCGTTWRP